MKKSFYQKFKGRYLERKPTFTEEQRNQFEDNLGSFRKGYDIAYGPGTIILRPRGLEKKL